MLLLDIKEIIEHIQQAWASKQFFASLGNDNLCVDDMVLLCHASIFFYCINGYIFRVYY